MRYLGAVGAVGAIALSAVALAIVLSASPPPVAVAGPSPALPTLPGGSIWVAPPPSSAGVSLAPSSSAPAVAPTPSPTVAPSGSVVATRIRIERLGIDLPIVEGDGIDAPLGKAAHFPGTGWPGGGVNIYLYGHARDGMFLPLWGARVGDRIVLSTAAGDRQYAVTQVVPKAPWNALEYLSLGTREILTLQTCTSYQMTAPRFIVIAEPAG